MHIATIAHVPPLSPRVAEPPTVDAKVVHVGTVTSLSELADVMPDQRLPETACVAVPGEGVLASTVPGLGPRALLSFGEGDHVILSIFDAASGKGALLHVAWNDQDKIDCALADMFEQLEAAKPGDLTASLIGGAWMTSPDDIGVKLRDGLMNRGIAPTWHQWAFPMGREDHHGVALDLSNGHVTVFEHDAELADTFYSTLPEDDVWSDFEDEPSEPGRPLFDESVAGARRVSDSFDVEPTNVFDVLNRRDPELYRTIWGVSLESLAD